MSLDFKRSLQVLNTKIDSQKFQTPEREVLLGALQKEPMFFTGLLDANKKTFRPFQNFEEVLTTSKMLADIITSTKSV